MHMEEKKVEGKGEGNGASVADVVDNLLKFRADCTAEADKKGYAARYAEAFAALKRGLAKIGMTVVDEEVGDGYFLFGYGTNSTAEFGIKQVPGWKFGIWFSPPKGNDAETADDGRKDVEGTMFWQVTDFIDKFKPSASVFSADLRFEGDLSDWEFGEYGDCAQLLRFTRDEPSLAFCRDVLYWDYNREYHSKASAFFHRIVTEWAMKAGKRRSERLGKRHAERMLVAAMRDFRASVGNICDRGPSVSPRYEVVLAVDGLDKDDYGWQPEWELEDMPRLGREIRRFRKIARKRSCERTDVVVVPHGDLDESKG